MKFGYFDDVKRSYVIEEPLPPRPWINYLGNRRLNAFISQNAGGLLWYLEPYTRRITRYHYLPAPGDRPGFYIYVRDRHTGTVWNPHFAPTCTQLDRFGCQHEPGITSFLAEKNGTRVEISYGIPPNDDVMLWKVNVANISSRSIDIQTVSYLEFGLLEFMREAIAWCYLKNHIGFYYDTKSRSIRYDYHVFEAPDCPAMAFACSAEVAGFECSRERFIGRTGTLERPGALGPENDLSNSELLLGGHGCGVLGVDIILEPGESKEFAYIFALGKTWDETDKLFSCYRKQDAIYKGFSQIRNFWKKRLESLQVQTGDVTIDRFVNIWNPYNSMITLQFARTISTDHMGTNGLLFRDMSQDALAVSNIDPEFATERMRMVFAQQKQDGSGCMAFYPHTSRATTDRPHRSDNTVWPVYTVKNLLAETGDLSFLDEVIAYRDKGKATIYEHIRLGIRHIYERRGSHGLPILYHADWNDGLALFQDERAESVMLAQQLVYSCREFKELAVRRGCGKDVEWCDKVICEMEEILNSSLVWDGAWYRRLLLSNGNIVGSASCSQGQIFLNTQSWAVISGIGNYKSRGELSMSSAHKRLDSDCGLCLLSPPFKGFPEPDNPPLGANPGIGENGGIFCQANAWAIIAECMLGNAERAFKYYRQLLPEVIISKVGEEHYQCEPYVYVSSIVGPSSEEFGKGGISWLTGTASWMYIAVTQYILGIRPVLDGLLIQPCLPAAIKRVRIQRYFRGVLYDIKIENTGRNNYSLEMDGNPVEGYLLSPANNKRCEVICRC